MEKNRLLKKGIATLSLLIMLGVGISLYSPEVSGEDIIFSFDPVDESETTVDDCVLTITNKLDPLETYEIEASQNGLLDVDSTEFNWYDEGIVVNVEIGPPENSNLEFAGMELTLWDGLDGYIMQSCLHSILNIDNEESDYNQYHAKTHEWHGKCDSTGVYDDYSILCDDDIPATAYYKPKGPELNPYRDSRIYFSSTFIGSVSAYDLEEYDYEFRIWGRLWIEDQEDPPNIIEDVESGVHEHHSYNEDGDGGSPSIDPVIKFYVTPTDCLPTNTYVFKMEIEHHYRRDNNQGPGRAWSEWIDLGPQPISEWVSFELEEIP